jgi:hypothetical protein
MLKQNFQNDFKKVTSKIITNQSKVINGFSNGANKVGILNSFYAFVELDTIDSLQNDDTDTNSMNDNLYFLQTQWIF